MDSKKTQSSFTNLELNKLTLMHIILLEGLDFYKGLRGTVSSMFVEETFLRLLKSLPGSLRSQSIGNDLSAWGSV